METINQILLDISSQKHILLICILAISVLSYLLMRYVVLNTIFHFFKRTSTDLDDILIETGFLNRLSYIVPLIITNNLTSGVIGHYETVYRFLISLIDRL